MIDNPDHLDTFLFCFFVLSLFIFPVDFVRQGFYVTLDPVLELALIYQAGLKLRDLPASAS